MAKFWIRQSSQYPGMAQHSKYARICLQRVLNISHTIHSLRSLLKVNVYPANIRLDEDVLKTSFIFVFRRRLHQDEHVCLSLTSSKRLQDVLVKANIFVLAIRLQDVFKTSWSRPIYSSWLYFFKTSSRHFQDAFKTFSRRLVKSSSRRFEKVFKRSSRHLQDVSSS